MRLLTRRVYRAFPELDRFSNEQCERFVHAARASARFQQAYKSLIGFLAIAAAGAVAIGAWLVHVRTRNLVPPLENRSGPLALAILGMFVGLAIPPVSGLLARDVLLRLRVRHVLRNRARCARCRYMLLGIPLTSTNSVLCPECGFATQVDPSLGELVVDESGRRMFQAAPDRYGLAPSWFTPRRVRRLKIAAIILALGIPLLGGLAVGGYELLLRRQAATARSERPGIDALIAHAETLDGPREDRSGPDPWMILDEATALRTTADDQVWRSKQLKTTAGDDIVPYFDEIYRSSDDSGDDERQRRTNADCRTLALAMIEVYREKGLFEKLREFAAEPPRLIPLPTGTAGPLASGMVRSLGDARQLARINSARMHLARVAGDLREFSDALDANLALIALTTHQPVLIDWLVGTAIESLTLPQVRALLSSRPGTEWQAEVVLVLNRRKPVPLSYSLESERILEIDTICWAFGDPAHVRWGRLSSPVGGMIGAISPQQGGRVGWYRENREAVDRGFREAIREADVPRYARPGGTAKRPASGLLLPDLMLPVPYQVIFASDSLQLDRAGVFTMLALERYRTDHGSYPATLAELVPMFIPELPLDPWSGAPLRYRLADPSADPQGRSYLLYSVGANGQDDGGAAVADSDRNRALRESIANDFIINDNRR